MAEFLALDLSPTPQLRFHLAGSIYQNLPRARGCLDFVPRLKSSRKFGVSAMGIGFGGTAVGNVIAAHVGGQYSIVRISAEVIPRHSGCGYLSTKTVPDFLKMHQERREVVSPMETAVYTRRHMNSTSVKNINYALNDIKRHQKLL